MPSDIEPTVLDDEVLRQTDRDLERPHNRGLSGWLAMLKKEPPEKVAKGGSEFVTRPVFISRIVA